MAIVLNETYGQVAYEAYAKALGIGTPWRQLAADVKSAWQAAAQAILAVKS